MSLAPNMNPPWFNTITGQYEYPPPPPPPPLFTTAVQQTPVAYVPPPLPYDFEVRKAALDAATMCQPEADAAKLVEHAQVIYAFLMGISKQGQP